MEGMNLSHHSQSGGGSPGPGGTLWCLEPRQPTLSTATRRLFPFLPPKNKGQDLANNPPTGALKARHKPVQKALGGRKG